MATTRDRQERLINAERELEPLWVAGGQPPPAAPGDAPTEAVPQPSPLTRLLGPISFRWAAIGAVAWVVLLGIGIAVEPPPTNPNAVDPWFVDALGIVFLTALVGAFAGFWLRRRWSLAASLLASGLLVVSTIACPASGHHTNVGAWWVVQLGCALGLVATSTLGLRRS
jgi:hypothetical protein